jgi:hypothetical protein
VGKALKLDYPDYRLRLSWQSFRGNLYAQNLGDTIKGRGVVWGFWLGGIGSCSIDLL